MKNEEQHIDFGARISRYLSGEMKPEERDIFEQELSADAEKKALFDDYSRLWAGVDQLAARCDFDMDAEWQSISGKMDFARDSDRSRRLRSFILRAAAIILIGMAGVGGWLVTRNMTQYEQVAANQGREVLELRDGSRVTLNEGTTLKYHIGDRSDVRKVKLTGEAYFEIARDSARPFLIEAGSAVIEVLGTSFNVKAYKENETVEVTVHSGLVAMAAKNRESRQIILNPGNAGIYNKSAKELDLVSKADPNNIAWKTRELVFSESPLSDVIRVINHVYHANITIADASLGNCTITVSFSGQELGAVLEVITNTLDLELQRTGAGFLVTGEGCEK